MKLIRDPFNGYKWQWKYYSTYIGRWFDYGPAFDSRELAEQYV